MSYQQQGRRELRDQKPPRITRSDYSPGSDEYLREILEIFDHKRLTTQVGTTLLDILGMEFAHVDEYLSDMRNPIMHER